MILRALMVGVTFSRFVLRVGILVICNAIFFPANIVLCGSYDQPSCTIVTAPVLNTLSYSYD